MHLCGVADAEQCKAGAPFNFDEWNSVFEILEVIWMRMQLPDFLICFFNRGNTTLYSNLASYFQFSCIQ